MVIEHLTFTVPFDLRARFLALDAEIWTAALATQPGYLGKEVWANHAAPDQIHLIIRWESRAAWKSIPAMLLADTEARFAAALGVRIPVDRCQDLDVMPAP